MNHTLFKDFTLCMVALFVIMVLWLLPHVNPPAVDDNSEPPGNVIVAINWPTGDNDVDLWVMGPGEVRPVGYSNKGGLLWNLLRDDLGGGADATSLNYENAYTRGILPGEYTVNVHCYRCTILPINVEVEISVSTEDGDKTSMKVVAVTRAVLQRSGEELTALRFVLTREGTLVPGTMNHLYRPLRSARK